MLVGTASIAIDASPTSAAHAKFGDRARSRIDPGDAWACRRIEPVDESPNPTERRAGEPRPDDLRVSANDGAVRDVVDEQPARRQPEAGGKDHPLDLEDLPTGGS